MAFGRSAIALVGPRYVDDRLLGSQYWSWDGGGFSDLHDQAETQPRHEILVYDVGSSEHFTRRNFGCRQQHDHALTRLSSRKYLLRKLEIEDVARESCGRKL